MKTLLEKYYEGIAAQLGAEVDLINRLFKHRGLEGEGNETVVRDLLGRLIPRRYGVGTGVVIDSQGNQSRQCDIVIYDALSYPALLALSSVHLFPVDMVYATIEVKTTLTRTTARQALENIASVRKLKMIQQRAEDQLYGTQEAHTLRIPGVSSLGRLAEVRRMVPPPGFVFAFRSTTRTPQTLASWFAPPSQSDINAFPSVVGCLDSGLMYFVDEQSRIVAAPNPASRFILHIPEVQDASGILLAFLLHLLEILADRELLPNPRLALHYLPVSVRHGKDIEIWRP